MDSHTFSHKIELSVRAYFIEGKMDVIYEGIFGPIVVELCKIGRTQLLDSNTFSRDATQIALSLLSLPVGDLMLRKRNEARRLAA